MAAKAPGSWPFPFGALGYRIVNDHARACGDQWRIPVIVNYERPDLLQGSLARYSKAEKVWRGFGARLYWNELERERMYEVYWQMTMAWRRVELEMFGLRQ